MLMEDITNRRRPQINREAAQTILDRYRVKSFQLLKSLPSNDVSNRFSSSTLRSLNKYHVTCIQDVDAVSESEDQRTARAMLIWHRVYHSYISIDF